MLIRFVVDNVLSFGKQREFNMIPMSSLEKLNEHKYRISNFDVLKMSSVYGANGSGKSNLIKSLRLLQEIVKLGITNLSHSKHEFKFNEVMGEKPITLVVEYFQDGASYLYGIQILNGIITTEELYKTGLGVKDDELLFERTTDANTKQIKIESPLFNQSEKSKIVKEMLENTFSKVDQITFRVLANMKDDYLEEVRKAIAWFDNTLLVVAPHSKPTGLTHQISSNDDFKKYTESTMKSFRTCLVKV